MKTLDEIIFTEFQKIYNNLSEDKRSTFFEQPEVEVLKRISRLYAEQYITAASGIIVNSDLPEEQVNKWLHLCVDYVDTEWFKKQKQEDNEQQ